MNTDYKLALTTICEYLVENKQRAEYVMNCFFMQDVGEIFCYPIANFLINVPC